MLLEPTGSYLDLSPPWTFRRLGLVALLDWWPPVTLCALKGCMPSEDSYAPKELVCPQGTWMPSRDL